MDREEIVDARLRRYYRLTPAGRAAAGGRGGPAALPRHRGVRRLNLNLAGGVRQMSEREEPSLSISELASLEHGYRRLLALYPGVFRQGERGRGPRGADGLRPG